MGEPKLPGTWWAEVIRTQVLLPNGETKYLAGGGLRYSEPSDFRTMKAKLQQEEG